MGERGKRSSGGWNRRGRAALLCDMQSDQNQLATGRVRRVGVRVIGGVIGLAGAGSGALAQSTASKEPPQAPIATIGKSSDANFVTILLVLVLAIAIVAVNFIPSKRGHQD